MQNEHTHMLLATTASSISKTACTRSASNCPWKKKCKVLHNNYFVTTHNRNNKVIKCLPIAERKGPFCESNSWNGQNKTKQNTNHGETADHIGCLHWCDYRESRNHTPMGLETEAQSDMGKWRRQLCSVSRLR